MLSILSRALLLVTVLIPWSGCVGQQHSVRYATQPDPPHSSEFTLTIETQPDADLQGALEALDREVCADLGMPADARAIGVVDLSGSGRGAWLRPDAQFYGASVPKICIALGYFERFPEQAEQLDPRVRRELELMIKRSDNELAAKYSKLVGLDYLQGMQLGSKYQLYDPEHGGGLWCGKHYGFDTPRTGDPLEDRSHAVTVRQCLRFYLMLEQGAFGDQASARLREIFRAPDLDFHDDNFVAGLRGRDVTVYRKNGLWEDWHLDTARVRHGDRVYLLAGATHHPDGGRYLERMARGIDELLCGDEADTLPQHHLIHHELDMALQPGSELVSPVIVPAERFDEAVLSWNVDCPEEQGFVVEMRVGDVHDNSWSPWLHVGDWGEAPPRSERVTKFDGGGIDIDYFRGTQRFGRLQYRVVAPPSTQAELRVARVSITTSDMSGLPPAVRSKVVAPTRPARSRWSRTLDVPYRSQKTEQPEIAGRICSPTSVAMVLEHWDLAPSTLTVANACLDTAYDLYGIWPRNVQAAYSFGSPGYLTRISDWTRVEQAIADGQPLVISIRVPKEGDLRNAPYKTTAGHLIVVTGLDGDEWVTVNDPAATTAEAGQLRYHRDDLTNVWMRATGGLTYNLAPRKAP